MMADLFLDAATDDADRLRDDPGEELIARMRAAFPTETEIDLILTRKLRRRAGGPHVMLSLAEMTERVRAFLADHVTGRFQVSDPHWLAGGASKTQFGFTLTTPGELPRRLVVRMEPAESLNATSRLREYQLLRAMDGVVPVPETPWVDAGGDWLPEPGIIYAFADGVTKPSTDRDRVSGAGMGFGPQLRTTLGTQFVAHLAAIHAHDWSGDELTAFDVPQRHSVQSVIWQLNRARRVWEEDRGIDLPAVEVAANWLQDNAPRLDTVSVLHGDYRSGNFLFDERSGAITAWLDWERGYLGDRHRDLAWTTTSVFGNRGDDGELLICGLVGEAEFFEEYQRASGLAIDPERLYYYRVLNTYQLVVSNLATGYRIVRLAKSHQDVLMAFVEGFVYPIADAMLRALEEGPPGA